MTENFDLRFKSGSNVLVGTIYLPDQFDSFPLVVNAHPASLPLRSDPYYDHLKTTLPEHGIGFLVFDRRGSGDSSGDFETASFEDLAEDVAAAVYAARERYSQRISNVTLLGASQGAWIEPLAAKKSDQIDNLILVSACGVTPADQMTYSALTALGRAGYGMEVQNRVRAIRARTDNYFRNSVGKQDLLRELKEIQAEPWFKLAFLPGDIDLPDDPRQSKWFLEMDYQPLLVWRDICNSSLFLYAEDDLWVPVDVSMANYRIATAHLPHVEFQVIPNTDHLMVELASTSPIISPSYLEDVVN